MYRLNASIDNELLISITLESISLAVAIARDFHITDPGIDTAVYTCKDNNSPSEELMYSSDK